MSTRKGKNKKSLEARKTILPRRHFAERDLINPRNPLIVYLIGAGGTGSQVLTKLGRMSYALTKLNHPGLQVVLWDSDTVSSANLGRQLFAESELGQNKAVALMNRTNRYFGTNWKAMPFRYEWETFAKGHIEPDRLSANIIVSCVDTVSARQEIGNMFGEKGRGSYYNYRQNRPYYWLDIGNSQRSGQAILSTIGTIWQPENDKYQPVGKLPMVTEEYSHELTAAKEDTTPSCSLAEALQRQDLFINDEMATQGCHLLWNLFKEGLIEYRGVFVNLADFRMQPVRV